MHECSSSRVVLYKCYIREISLYVQRCICMHVRVDFGLVIGFKINPYFKIKYTFEIFYLPAVKPCKTISFLVFRIQYPKKLNAAICTFYTYTSLKTYKETSLLLCCRVQIGQQ